VTASEFAFLGLGLTLGVAAGATLIEVLRSRPPAPREVRVTVAPNSLPRRSTTLTDGAFAPAPGPARGGPADRRWVDRDLPPEDAPGPPSVAPPWFPGQPRTTPLNGDPIGPSVPSGRPSWQPGWSPNQPGWLPPKPAYPLTGPILRSPGTSRSSGPAMLAIPIEPEPDPLLAALRVTAASVASAAMTSTNGSNGHGPEPVAATGDARRGVGVATAVADGPGDGEPAAEATAPQAGTAGPAPDGVATGACADERRIVDERCTVAGRAREEATRAQEVLRTAQRSADEHTAMADEAAGIADPRAIRVAKDAAQHAFRTARTRADSVDAVEAAARRWLQEINRINGETRDAAARAAREREAAATAARALERLGVEADAARISAEMAEDACLRAREELAACEERAAQAATAAAVAASAAASPPAKRAGAVKPESRPPVPQPARTAEDILAAAAIDEDAESIGGSRIGDAVIVHLVRGDRTALARVVNELAGEDPAERRRWQVALTELVEAIVGRSIEAAAFAFPPEDPFWSLFNRAQARDLMGALASLGYRFDGYGGWVDDRQPSQRDLSLAVGYAGLDPMRIRRWPTEAEMASLLRGVRVAADEYLGEAAAGLSLGELVSMLGRRADGLTDLWNEWGRVRPLLLQSA
jgi:hypothetical protein